MSSLPAVWIINRNELEREGLRRLLTEQSFAVSGTFRDHRELDREWSRDRSEIAGMVIVDTATNETSVEACHFVHEHWPTCKIVVLSANLQTRAVAEALAAGADGYVSKHVSCASLTEMLKLVALGETMIPSQVMVDFSSPKADTQAKELAERIGDADLSAREIDILRGLIRGEPNKVISRQLDITEATVKVHVKSIMRKLGVINRTQAAIWGMSRGVTSAVLVDGAKDPHAQLNGSTLTGNSGKMDGDGKMLLS